MQNVKVSISELTESEYCYFCNEKVFKWCEPEVKLNQVKDFLSSVTNEHRADSLMERVDALKQLQESLSIPNKDLITAEMTSTPEENCSETKNKVCSEVRFEIGNYFCVVKESITEVEANFILGQVLQISAPDKEEWS